MFEISWPVVRYDDEKEEHIIDPDNYEVEEL